MHGGRQGATEGLWYFSLSHSRRHLAQRTGPTSAGAGQEPQVQKLVLDEELDKDNNFLGEGLQSESETNSDDEIGLTSLNPEDKDLLDKKQKMPDIKK